MDAGQVTIMPAAQGTSTVAIASRSLPATQDTTFGSLLGQTMSALEGANSQSSGALPVMETESVDTGSSVALEKLLSEDEELLKQPKSDGDLATAIQDSAMLAQISAMQMMLVAQPEQITKVVAVAGSTDSILAVELTAHEMDNTLQSEQIVKNQTAPEFQLSLTKPEDTPIKAESGYLAANVRQPAKEVDAASPIMSSLNPVKNAMQNSTAVAPGTENSQQSVLAIMQQSNPGQQPVIVADSSPQVLKSAQESRAPATEIAVVTKTAAPTPVASTIRFSQASDVVAATSNAGAEGGLSSQLGRQGGKGEASFGSATKTLEALPESGLVEQLSETGVQGRPVEHQLFVSPSGQRGATTEVAVTADQLKPGQAVQITSQVAERLVKHEIKTGNDQISLKLSPENLGSLQLNLRMEDQRLKIEIVAENRGVRDALLQQAGDLKETLARQNIQMDSFNVTTGNNGNNSQQSQNWRQMTAEQRQQSTHYASRQSSGNIENYEGPVHYFAHQYQSTIDVRF